jgi:hypothetical protein
MSKIVIIKRCDECPYFDNIYFSYEETCLQLNRGIPFDEKYEHRIPEDCPLEDTINKEEDIKFSKSCYQLKEK